MPSICVLVLMLVLGSITADECTRCLDNCGGRSDDDFCRALICSEECSPDAECPGLGLACDCPKSTWGFTDTPPTREQVCARLPSTVLMVGDSLMRDTWTAGALWLLMQEVPDITDCMFAAWRFTQPVIDHAKAAGLLVENLTMDKSVSIFYVCERRTRLIFRYGRLFSDLPAVQEEALAQGAGALVITHGILEMSSGDDQLLPWGSALARLPYPVVYLGAHSRIIPMTPPEFMDVAIGAQGNKALQRYTSVMKTIAKRSALRVVDPFALTSYLTPEYRDTEDGLHFGAWINLQRFWLVVEAL